jgi:hypothetical protein
MVFDRHPLTVARIPSSRRHTRGAIEKVRPPHRRDACVHLTRSRLMVLGGALEPATHGTLVRGILRREACLQVPLLFRDHDERHDGHRRKKRDK